LKKPTFFAKKKPYFKVNIEKNLPKYNNVVVGGVGE
jgi:hypothetical protein